MSLKLVSTPAKAKAAKLSNAHNVSYHDISPATATLIQNKLISWYNENRRKLPWRGDPPPYGKISLEEPPKKKARKQQSTLSSFFKPVSTPKLSKLSKSSKSKYSTNSTKKSSKSSIKSTQKPNNSECSNNKNNQNPDDSKDADITITTSKSSNSNNSNNSNNCNQSNGSIGSKNEITAYNVWISEIMLQQTRVETVIEYYLKWMQKFPTIEALASATLEEVNQVWAGLGYYRRANFIHQAAIDLVNNHKNASNSSKSSKNESNGSNGDKPQEGSVQLPETVSELLKMKGVGEYTAGAIGSIAYNLNVACVDGNVVRVVSRILGICCYSSPPQKYHWHYTKKLIKNCKETGKLNQALMELGATVCLPNSRPLCAQCPVRMHCKAWHEQEHQMRPFITSSDSNNNSNNSSNSNSIDSDDNNNNNNCDICVALPVEYMEDIGADCYPLKRPKTKIRQQIVACAVVSYEYSDDSDENNKNKTLKRKYFMRKRGKFGLLANQWEFVTVVLSENMIENKNLNNKERKQKDSKNKEMQNMCWQQLQTKLSCMFELDETEKSSEKSARDEVWKKCKYMGTSVHIFSHIRQVSYVFDVVLQSEPKVNEKNIGPDPMLQENDDLADKVKEKDEKSKGKKSSGKGVKKQTKKKKKKQKVKIAEEVESDEKMEPEKTEFGWFTREEIDSKGLTMCFEKIWKCNAQNVKNGNKSCKKTPSVTGKKRKRSE